MTKTPTDQNQGGRPRSYSPALVHQIVSDMLKAGKQAADIDATAVRDVLCAEHDVSPQIRMESLRTLVDATLDEIEETERRALVEKLPPSAIEAISAAMAVAERDLKLLVARQNSACHARAQEECEELRADKRNANWRIAELESTATRLKQEKEKLEVERESLVADVARLGTELANSRAELERIRGEDGAVQLIISQLQRPAVRNELLAALSDLTAAKQ